MAPLNFYASVMHQTKHMQQQSISERSLVAMSMSIYSSQMHEISYQTLIIPRLKRLPVLIGVRGLLFVTKALKIEVTERIL